jgi:phosphoglucomutase
MRSTRAPWRPDGVTSSYREESIVPALLAAEIIARADRDPGEIYRELIGEFGEPVSDPIEAPATPAQKQRPALWEVRCTHSPARRSSASSATLPATTRRSPG